MSDNQKGNHIKTSIHFDGYDKNHAEEINIGDRVYIAHLPYSLTSGYIVTNKYDDTFIMDGVSISESLPAIYKSKKEAAKAIAKYLEEIINE